MFRVIQVIPTFGTYGVTTTGRGINRRDKTFRRAGRQGWSG